ncbi:helix-turn-helix domain-containing protein [Endozoicomonas sp. SM1973]|uniref:Helix-turn-helix domain-containing protein n=1 Tax=Spartinivicinus marinus TaxID=2994442 RepID=A0A853I4E2_9GAMM|nr:XRE family transcriptional regulator [Spartinivicinus marinus]MCX4026623.1 XRE family transcriptional regulator [Spartinivicinus marinus]NYZ64457.1 helix-turn-helix domain-containing protein [Spartinivicinus marinus]
MIGKRLKQAREHLGLTQEELAELVSISQTAIYKIEDGITQQPRSTKKLAKALSVSPEWLQYGINPPFWLESAIDQSAPYREKGLCPLISWVQAGSWQPIFEVDANDADLIPCPVKCSDQTFVLRVQGISMEPVFHEGDLLFVDPEAHCHSGSFIVARLDESNEATFKQLIIEDGHHFLKPLNPDWPDKIIPMKGTCSIVGKVIFTGRAL